MNNRDLQFNDQLDQPRQDIIALSSRPREFAAMLIELLQSQKGVVWIPTHMDLIGESANNFKAAFEIWKNPEFALLFKTPLTLLDAYIIALEYKEYVKYMVLDDISPETGEVSRRFFLDSFDLSKLYSRKTYKKDIADVRRNPDQLFKGDMSLREVVMLSDLFAELPYELRNHLNLELMNLTKEDNARVESIWKVIQSYANVLNNKGNKFPFGVALNNFKTAIMTQASYIRSKTLELTSLYLRLVQENSGETILISAAPEANFATQYSFRRVGVTPDVEDFGAFQISPFFVLANIVATNLNDEHTDLREPMSEREWEREMLQDHLFQGVVYYNANITREEAKQITDEIMHTLSDSDIDLWIEAFNKKKPNMNLDTCLVQIKGGDKRYDLTRGIEIKKNWLPKEG